VRPTAQAAQASHYAVNRVITDHHKYGLFKVSALVAAHAEATLGSSE